MRVDNRIDYIEIPVTDPARAREFFAGLFGWEFQEWGADYFSFNDGRLDGGLRRAEEPAPASGVLLVFISSIRVVMSMRCGPWLKQNKNNGVTTCMN